MGIRITNSIMNNNSKNNINTNKINEDKLNTMMASGQKITRPSDDPVVAIRALRLNSNITQANQYYDKNIPDAEAWLKITETALTQTDTVLTKIKESLTQGASDDNTASDRMNILKDLQGMRDQIYASGNADYADRTVFTGYRTGETLTFTEAEERLYSIKEEFDNESIGSIKRVYGELEIDKTGSDLSTPFTAEDDVYDETVYRLRLAYDGLKPGQSVNLTYNVTDDSTTPPTVTPYTVALTTTDTADDVAYTPPATGARLITTTGEIILSESLRDTLQSPNTSDISVEYQKEKWNKNDLRPEHYFQCKDLKESPAIEYNYYDTDGVTPIDHFKNQSISYEISFNQSIVINTNANQVFTHDICRDVDELIMATQAVIDADSDLEKLEKMATETERFNQAELDEIDSRIKALTKKRDLLADNMQKMFSKGLTTFDEYADRNNMVLTEVGSTRKRVELTKERMSEQLSSFKELADENININLSDTAIDLSNAELALEAARMATGKIAQQTLLNYL